MTNTHKSSEPAPNTSPLLAQLFQMPDKNNSSHLGPIIAETPTGFVQQVAQDRFILHDKATLDGISPSFALRALAHHNIFANITYRNGRATNLSPIPTTLANTTDGIYHGEIFLATPTEYHQRITPNCYIRHDRQLIDKQLEKDELSKPFGQRPSRYGPPNLEPGSRLSITYHNGKSSINTPDKQQAAERSNAR